MPFISAIVLERSVLIKFLYSVSQGCGNSEVPLSAVIQLCIAATNFLQCCDSWVLICLIVPDVTTDLHHPCSNKVQKGDILVPAYPGCLGKWPLNKCCYFCNCLLAVAAVG